MLGRLLDRILHENDEQLQLAEETSDDSGGTVWRTPSDLLLALGIFVLSVAPRLYFLFQISDPQNAGDGWYGDTYHHWQIAYLTREIGFTQGFLRLWDLKGMEYFWGPLHPFLTILMFKLTGSVSIVNVRLLSLFFGAMFISVLYLLISKYWNRDVGIATSLLAIVHPVAILNDTSGMLEPIGYSLLLLGLLVLDVYPIFAGLLWALASFARAEAWMFGGLLLLLSYRLLKRHGQMMKVFFGWLIPMLLYTKYLLDHTGNPIYPIWWNYLANARGVWAANVVYSSYQLSVKPYLTVWFVISLILLVGVWSKNKGKSSLFLLFGFANWAFISGFLGLTHYLSGFQPWFWYIRFFELPYTFAGFLIVLILLYLLPKWQPLFKKGVLGITLWLPILALALVYQIFFWEPILAQYDTTRQMWERTKKWAREATEVYNGGTMLIPEGNPSLTYALVYLHGIEGKDLLGQMFDPFFYLEDNPFENWEEKREIVLGWMKDENVRVILVDKGTERYTKLFAKEQSYFEFVKTIPDSPLLVYRFYPNEIKLQ